MVSNARLDLPEPDKPVMTIIRSRGSSTEMFRRLWTRAPWTEMVVLGAPRAAFLFGTRRLREEERELLDVDAAPLGQQYRRRRLADQPFIGEVLARGRHTRHVEVLPEV